MHIVNRPLLLTFTNAHAAARQPVLSWLNEAEHSVWKTPSDVKERFSSASFLADNRIVINIKGNAYRLLIRVNYPAGVVQILFIGTHAEYDKIDAEKYK